MSGRPSRCSFHNIIKPSTIIPIETDPVTGVNGYPVALSGRCATLPIGILPVGEIQTITVRRHPS
ncbi:hypothetical protein HNR17_002405 [Galbitalea soli]|nr:hypothetical protein [Galbitalea soli]